MRVCRVSKSIKESFVNIIRSSGAWKRVRAMVNKKQAADLPGVREPGSWTWSQITACTRIVYFIRSIRGKTMYIAKGKLSLIVNHRNALTNLSFTAKPLCFYITLCRLLFMYFNQSLPSNLQYQNLFLHLEALKGPVLSQSKLTLTVYLYFESEVK